MRTTTRAAALTTAVLAGAVLAGCGGSSSSSGPSAGETVPPSTGPVATASAVRQQSSAPSSRTSSATPSTAASTPGSEQSDADSGEPYRLTLSSLSISAKVISITADNGTLEPPTSIREVGWWSQGARPGAGTGTAVLVGHAAHRGGGVFDHLDRAKAGDTIDVDTSNGRVQYTVTRTAVYDKDVFARHAEEIEGQSGPGRLSLISCENWNGHVWTSNVIVYAKRV